MKKNLVKEPEQLLSQLALEYRRKSDELNASTQGIDLQTISYQLQHHAELTTDRFRMAQKALLESLISDSSDFPDEVIEQAALTLCRCFDEMRILFLALVDEVRHSRV